MLDITIDYSQIKIFPFNFVLSENHPFEKKSKNSKIQKPPKVIKYTQGWF